MNLENKPKYQKGLISRKLMENFRSEYNFGDYAFLAGTFVSPELFISCLSILFPAFYEHEGRVFCCVHDWQDNPEKAISRYIPSQSKKENEANTNVFEVGESFMAWVNIWREKNDYTDEREEKDWLLLIEIARAIQYCWTLKLKQDFPDREFVFEIGDGTEEFYGEYGVCLTFYEKVLSD